LIANLQSVSFSFCISRTVKTHAYDFMITATYFKNHLSDLNFELRCIQYKFQ